jgi:hypothetical protein
MPDVLRSARRLPLARLTAILAGAAIAACGGGRSSPVAPGAAADGPFALKAAVVDPANVDFIVPLGNLNPPGHTLPTDHIYFYVGFLRPSIRAVPVFAPGDGTVQDVFGSGTSDVKVFVRVNGTFSYYVDHVVPDAGIARGGRVTAGQRLGTSGTAGFGVDLGVLNFGLTVPFVTPGRYSGDSLHADAPLKYYDEPLRSQLYALVRREGADKDGKIDFDVAGRLQGNWFHESLPIGESAQPAGWTRHLAFVYDNVQPAQPRISIGGVVASAGVFGVADGDPSFSTVTPESGIVAYRLRYGGALGAPLETQAGTLIVQMLDASRIRVEVSAAAVPPASFSAAAQVYVR